MYLSLDYGRIVLNWKTITNHYSLASAMKKIKDPADRFLLVFHKIQWPGEKILKINKNIENWNWKILKCEKYTGFKAEMEKNRPIRDQFPHRNCVPIVKCPHFSWLYGLAMVPWAPKNVGDSKINFRKLFDNTISTFYCWLYFPTSIVHNLDYLLTPERYACQRNV